MGIPQKLEKTLTITISGGRCTEYNRIQVSIKQAHVKFVFDPMIIDDETIAITINSNQARQLNNTPIQWQVIAEDDGENIYTPVYTASIDEILEGWRC